MSDTLIRVDSPGNFAPTVALAYGAPGAAAVAVTPAAPLPVRLTVPVPGASLAGTASESGQVGPFVPEAGLAIWVALTGEGWAGRVRLLRAAEEGAAALPLTVGGGEWGSFTGPANEPVIVENDARARYFLSIELTQGTLGYRVSQ